MKTARKNGECEGIIFRAFGIEWMNGVSELVRGSLEWWERDRIRKKMNRFNVCVCVCGYLHNYKSLSSRRVAKNKERKKKKTKAEHVWIKIRPTHATNCTHPLNGSQPWIQNWPNTANFHLIFFSCTRSESIAIFSFIVVFVAQNDIKK